MEERYSNVCSDNGKKLISQDTSEEVTEVSKSSQVEDKGGRRFFTAEYKLAILKKLEECRITRSAVG